jgi:eukaryotic-like serine/threonine-protein kinase
VQERPRDCLAPGDVVGGTYVVDSITSVGPTEVRATAVTKKGRHVVLTTLTSSAASRLSPDAIESFLKTARASMGLTNSHVVKTLDAGKLASGIPYVATELDEGSDLAVVLQRDGVMRPYLAIDYLRQAL